MSFINEKEEVMEIRYDITLYVPGTVCNMRCEYCYVTQCIDENHSIKANLKYPLETVISAFSPNRLKGLAHITVISGGETLLCQEVIPLLKGLLEYGHVISLVTNVTIRKRLDELLNFDRKLLSRLLLKGSLHWNELIRLNKLNFYFEYMRKFRAAGASINPFIVIGPSYYDKLQEIHDKCINELGDVPDCTPCFKMPEKTDIYRNGKFYSDPPINENYLKMEEKLFNSKVFKTSVKWLDIDPKKVFCYAGKWSFYVVLETGALGKCHGCPPEANFFENIDKMPKLEAIGTNCQISTCALQYNFIGEGLIPEYDDEFVSFGKMIFKKKFVSSEVANLLDYKFYRNKTLYSKDEENKVSNDVEILFRSLKNKEK